MNLAGCEGPWDTDRVPSLTCNVRAAEAAAPLLCLLPARFPRAFPSPSLLDALTGHNNLFPLLGATYLALFCHVLSSATLTMSNICSNVASLHQ